MKSRWLLAFQSEQLSGEQFNCYLQTWGRWKEGIVCGDWGQTRILFEHVKFKISIGHTNRNVISSFVCGSVVQGKSGIRI